MDLKKRVHIVFDSQYIIANLWISYREAVLVPTWARLCNMYKYALRCSRYSNLWSYFIHHIFVLCRWREWWCPTLRKSLREETNWMTLEREQVGCICILGVYHITRNFQERKISHVYQTVAYPGFEGGRCYVDRVRKKLATPPNRWPCPSFMRFWR